MNKLQEKARDLIIIFLLTIANAHLAFSLIVSQNPYAFPATIDSGTTESDQTADYAWSQPSNTTASISQGTTTHLPFSTNIKTEETLDTSETNVLNQHAGPSHHHEDYIEDDDPEDAPNHAIPYSEHEEPRDVPTQPKYVAPGAWAKPPPEKDIPLDFVPTKLHAQVRGTHTVKRLPQQEAIESAESEEEKRNAPRLREIVTNSKVNTVYTEEGYEDSAYDHAGHIRDADFHEGFARKVHDRKDDRRDSSSGKKRTGKHMNLIPEGFKEYEEDYQDHVEENRKTERISDGEDNLIGYGRNIWEGSEIDSKLVVEDGARELEKDVEKDAAEAEKSSKDYQNTQESRLRNDIKADSPEKSNQGESDLRDEESELVKRKKKKKTKSKLQNGKVDVAIKESKPSRRLERKKKLHATTVIPHEETSVSTTPAASPNPHKFVTNPVSSQLYSIDQTTLRYVAPIATSSFQRVDEPTTVSYSQLFWDYFKAQQGPVSTTTESPALIGNSTILNPHLEKQTPIAVATIDDHGPYLLVTKQETTTSPLFDFYSQDSFSGQVEFNPSSAQIHTRRLLGQNDDDDDESNYGNVIAATSTVATFTSVQPLLLQSSLPSNSEETRSLSPTTLEESTFSSTPAVMTLNITQQAYSRIAGYQENPFLKPILDSSNIAVSRNRIKYKVLVRPTKKIVKKPVTPRSTHQETSSPSSLQESSEKKKLRNELNTKYTKMLDYIPNKPKIQKPFSEKKKLVSPEDLTLLRPPIPQQVVYPIFSTDRPSVANHSGVIVESESPRVEANWRSSLQDRHRFQPIKSPYRFDSLSVAQPVRPSTYLKDPFPVTKLLPPSSRASFASIYANYRGDFSYSKPQQQQQRDNVFRYFPLVPEASWQRHFRRKRSEQDATRSASLAGSRDSESGISPTLMNKSKIVTNGESEKAEELREAVIDRPKLTAEKPVSIQSPQQNDQINVSNAEKLTRKRNISLNEGQSEVNLKDSVKRRDHEELLDESSKISGDVIDKEIAMRFNEKEDNGSPAKTKKDEKVEVDIPSFDYVEEIAEDSLAESSTTTESTVNSKKYPFYNNKDVPSASALKYVVDPRTIPRKTARGMEFYESRNAYKQCDEVEPNLDRVLPEKEEPDPDRKGPQEDLPRLRGLGDKLDCFKAKYFDENPLDSPLFAEKLVEEPTPPSELDPLKFASRIMVLPEEDDEYIVQQFSKRPERYGRQWSNRNRPYETHESIRVNYKHDPQTGRGRNAYLHTVRGTRLSNVARRKTNNRRSRPRSSTQSPKLIQIASYQNQVYEDVMGNIRNMANTYEVHEVTTLPSTTQILAAAGSETALKIANTTSNSSKEKSTSLMNVTDVISSPKSSMIKGLVPPPKYSPPRQIINYRKHRPPGKSRAVLLRSSNLPRIIAHHRTIKINKRSVTEDIATRNSSESAINKDEKTATEGSTQIIIVGNNTVRKSEETMQKTNATSEMSDLAIEESRQIGMQDRSLSTTLKIDDKKRRDFSSSDQKNEPPQKIIYTIRDRIRYSKPKWDTRGFSKFSTNPKTADEDNRRKEPRYNHFKRKKTPTDDQRNNSMIFNSTVDTWKIESAVSSIGGRESGTTEAYRPEESVMHQMMYDGNDEVDPEPKNTENLEETESEENSEEESTTSTYQVHENIEENVTTTTESTNPPEISEDVLNVREYLESNPPGYEETFPEEATTLSSSGQVASADNESDDDEEKQHDEGNNYRKIVTTSWDDDSSEKAEEQIETPTRTESSTRDDDSEELSSKEEEGSNKTFFAYRKQPTSVENDEKDDEEGSKKTTFYRSFPFSRYKSKFKKESDEDESEEEDKEAKSEDYVFPWHADKGNKRKRFQDSDRYEYPWERRERLARERREKRQRANRFKKLIFDDEDEEESTKRERPVYPWERYDVPSKTRANARRGISRRYINEESSSEQPSLKFSSKYSSSDVGPFSAKSSKAREISRSIKEILDGDTQDESKEESSKEFVSRSPSSGRKTSSLSERGISRGTLVPENITQPPRRKTGRQGASRVDESTSGNLRFSSKRLRSKENDKEEEEEEDTTKQLNNFDKDNAESGIETTSNQSNQILSSTTEVSSGQRMKRRRRIPKNNSTISVSNSSVRSSIESTRRRRRRPQTSTTASTNIDLETSKSVFVPVRRRYSHTDKIVKTNNQDSERSEDDHPAETSTSKTGTIERRSRISKEKIVTKTVYPDEEGKFDSVKVNATRKEPVRQLKITSKRRSSNSKQNDNGDNKKELIKSEDEEKNSDKFFSKDEIKRSAMLGESRVENEDNPLKSFEVKRSEVKRINDYSIHDRIINDENDNDFGASLEVYAVSNLLHNTLPNPVSNDHRSKNEWNRTTEEWKRQNGPEEVEGRKDENAEETRRPSLLQTKYIKNPERRLYYYVE